MTSDFSLFTSLRYDVKLKQVPSQDLQHAGWNHQHESPLYMLDYHRDRILRAALHWQWDKVVELLSGEQGLTNLSKRVDEEIGTSETNPLRLQIVISKDGDFTFNRSKVPHLGVGNLFPETLPAPGTTPGPNQPQVPPLFVVVVDKVDSARSEYTHFKTTKRAMYDAARSRAGIGSSAPADATEVLIVNEDEHTIMEGSITTPFFWRDGQWVTPPVSPKFSRQDGSGGNDGTTRRWALERGLAIEQEIKASQLVDGEVCYISNGVHGFRAGVIRLNSEQ